MVKKVISVTGHRLLTAGQIEKINPILKTAIIQIMRSATEQYGPISFIALSPLAQGADTLFANAALSLGIPLQILLPFERDEYMKDFTSGELLNEFNRLYDMVSGENKRVLNTTSGHERNDLYMDVGREIVNEADYIIAIWNERESKGKGGTGDVVAYALEEKKHILIINPEEEQPSIQFINP